ncbi:MAG: DUF7507 domain-containing protein, partial [Nocardioides sp.]
YTVTATDVREGSLLNKATAFGLGQSGTVPGRLVEVSAVDDLRIPTAAPPRATLELTKEASSQGPFRTGDAIRYTFTVQNTGNVVLTDVGVSDPMVGAVTCQQTTLAVGESTTCTAAPYTVTAADIQAGKIVNRASASGNECLDPAPRVRAGSAARIGAKCSAITDRDSVTVKTVEGSLIPQTGSPMSQLVPLTGLALFGAGLSLIVAGRRRKSVGRS